MTIPREIRKEQKMKALRVLLGAAIMFSLIAVMTGSAAAISTYSSGFQVQNLSASTANVVISYYNKDGTKNIADVSDTIPASGSKTYFPIAALSGFNGSVVVSSDQKVAAIANVLGDGTAAGASYDAAMAGGGVSSPLLIPLVMKANNGINTWFNVQNTGSSDASVTVTYSDGKTATATIKPGAAATFDQALEDHAAGFVGSAKVSSNQPVAAAVMEVTPKILFAYSSFAAGSTSPVMPLINANNSGVVTGVQIQNAGTNSTDVTVSYSPSAGGGTACTETQTVPAGQSKTFALLAFAGALGSGGTTTCVAKALFVGSAKVTANSASQPLVAIVNQLGASNGEAYNAFDAATATQSVVMPLIMDRVAGGILFTAYSVMNVGSAATTVTCTYSGSSKTETIPLASGASSVKIQQNAIGSNYVGSATCTATNASDKIIGVVNELNTTAGIDGLLVYEAVNN
jgi:hypothetical protein